MIEQNASRPARKVAISDHIWEAFEDMAEQMGTDRDGLINQAMFMFARLNGFLEVNGAIQATPAAVAAAVAPARGAPAPVARSAPPVLTPMASKAVREEAAQPVPARPAPRPLEDKPAPTSGKLDDDPVRREVAERVLETAAELERLIKGKNAPPPEEDFDEPAEDLDDVGDVDVGSDDEPVDEGSASESEGPAGRGLFLVSEGGSLDKIVKDRFVIGRGKHCDLVINSGKVSREHAVIVREGGDHFIEDLGSSNGTWFNKQRIKRRKVEDGDEYFICSEKVKLVVR